MMPEEVVKDPIIDEEAQLNAELERIKREGPQETPPVEAAAAEPIPPAETPPAEPKVEAKPAEPTPPAPTEPKRDGAAWKMLRQREKELEVERAEKERLAAELRAKTQPAADPDFDTHPADYLKLRIERTEQQLAQERAERERIQQEIEGRNYIDTIKRQEETFSKDHPDYYKAAEYLIDKDIKQWERAGLSTLHTNQILQAARSADPRFQPYRENISQLVNDPGVTAQAEKDGRDPEEVAAWVMARNTWVTQRRDLLAQGARARGVSVAEVAYEEAVDRGWNGNPQDGAKDPKLVEAARARVQQAKEVSAATHSLSDSATAEAAPEVRVLRNRQEVLNLDDESLDRLIASGQYRSL